MVSEASTGWNARWQRQRFPLTLAVLVIFYVVGTVGILSRYSDLFVRLTFANLVLTALLLLSNERRFDRRTAMALGIAASVGFAAEVIGVKTGILFGNYHYTDRLGPRLFEVPVVIGLNWALLVHAVHSSLAVRVRSPLAIAAVGASLMTAFDWVMEPVAIRLRFWVWLNDDVPWQNYVAWWLLAFLLIRVSVAVNPTPQNRLSTWVFGVMLVFFATVGTILS